MRVIELQAHDLHRKPTSAAEARERLVWRIASVKEPTAYVGCTLKPGIDEVIVLQLGWREVAVKNRSPDRGV